LFSGATERLKEVSLQIAAALSLFVVTPIPWYADWTFGLPLIVLTLVIHVLGLLFIDEKVARVKSDVVERYGYRVVFVVIIGATAMLIAVMHGIEAVLWAVIYWIFGALPDYRDAVLYSLSAMTSYGHANVVLEKRWQLMGALEALDGMLLFGVTTAFLFGIIQRARELQARRPR
jgi:hypothetical protein